MNPILKDGPATALPETGVTAAGAASPGAGARAPEPPTPLQPSPNAGVTGLAFGNQHHRAPSSPAAKPRKVVRYERKQYWNEPTMTLWEKAYLPEVLRGLAITTGIFLRNMGKWLTGRKGAVTTYYPEEKRSDFAPRNRGKHILTQRPDGSPQCIACNMCATVCPAKVIEIESGFDPNDPAHPKFPVRFEIDYSRCVFCGMCVEACPEDAIRMQDDVPNLVSDDRYNMWMTMDEMLTWKPQQDVAKPYPPKPVPLTLGDSVKRGRGRSTP